MSQIGALRFLGSQFHSRSLSVPLDTSTRAVCRCTSLVVMMVLLVGGRPVWEGQK